MKLQLENPYIAGAPLRGQQGFWGRQVELAWVSRELRNTATNALVLFGQRRIGKTSLLLQLRRVLSSGTLLPIYFDLQDRASHVLSQVLADLADTVAESSGLKSPDPNAFDDRGRFFLNTFMHQLYQTLGTTRRPVFLLDEFDVLDQPTEKALPHTAASKSLFPFLRYMMANDPRPAFVFAVGRRAEDLSLDFSSTFKASLIREIWVLDRESAESVVRQAEVNGTLRFSERAVARILELTSRHPYLIQLLCQRIWERAYIQSPSAMPHIDVPEVENAVSDALESGKSALIWLWNGLSPAEKVYAAALAQTAREQEIISEESILKVLEIHAPRLRIDEARLASDVLVQRHVVEQLGKREYRFAVELLRRWVQQNKPLWAVKDELDQLDPLADSIFRTGLEYMQRNKLEPAIRNFRDALDINPRHFRAQLRLGEALLEIGEIDMAVAELEKAHKLDPEEAKLSLARALVAQAKARIKAEHFDDANAITKLAIGLDPNNIEVKNLRTVAVAGTVRIADFIGRDQITISYGVTASDVERLIDRVLAFLQRGATFIHAGDALRAEVDGEVLTFRPGAIQQLAGSRSERSYLLSLTVRREYQIWATKFIPLAAQMDVKRSAEALDMPVAFSEFRVPREGEGLEALVTTVPLADITEAIDRHAAFVILGEPGAGKTTTLQKIAFEAARKLLLDGAGRVPLFVRLSQQAERTPLEFLRAEWERRTGSDFADALAAGRALLLADGVNELPRDERDERLKAWRLFAGDHCEANQVIFTGREKDYEGQLNLPRVRVEPLDDERIADYLRRNDAAGLGELLDDPKTRLREMARNPFNLALLAYAYKSNRREMGNRGRLLEWFAGELFAREERLAHKGWIRREAQVQALAQLAYAMQAQGEGTTVPPKAARDALPPSVEVNGEDISIKPADVFRFARAATILDPAIEPDVRFYHHLLQEYFAAIDLLRRFEAGEDLGGLWTAPRRTGEMPPAGVGEWDPLPEPPATGWEVTTILACGLARDPARLVEAIHLHNPVLAGRCLDEAGVYQSDDPNPFIRFSSVAILAQRVRADLLADLYNPAVHLRARLQAGFTLGRIGDPRLEPTVVNGTRVILPQMRRVPAATIFIGESSDDPDAYQDEMPQHTVDLPEFEVGTWPVTNAEYTCFIAAGGYVDERYWTTSLSRRWLIGEDMAGGLMEAWMTIWKELKRYSDWRVRFERKGVYSPDQIQTLEYIAELDEPDLRSWLSDNIPKRSRQQPAFWKDTNYNNPSQPAVGVTWFEAQAYCRWLSAVSGKLYRLPTEVEWEAAARGTDIRHYLWGNDWDAGRANTIEGRVLKPSPIGAYAAAGGVGPFGTEDQSGNVWNWTNTLYRPYPYQNDDRENVDSEGERTIRGGSWDNSRWFARCTSRFRHAPDFYSDDIGFRVILPSRSTDL